MGAYGEQTLWEESISQVTATNSVEIGSTRRIGGKEYIYVYNGSTNQDIAIGRGAKIASQSVGYTVDVDTDKPATLTADVCVGIAQSTSIPTGEYGWLQTKGYCSRLHNKVSAVVTGEIAYLAVSGTFQRFSSLTDSNMLPQAAVGRVITGGLDTTATNTFDAFIDCSKVV